MEYRRRFLLEKVALQVLSVAAVAAVYFLLAKAWAPNDPEAATSFMLAGDSIGALWCVLSIWALAAVVGAATIYLRPQGSMLIVFFGAGGTALRSPRIRAWLWQRNADLPAMYRELAVELLAGAVVLLIAAIILDATRRMVAELKPDWLWRSPLAELTAEELAALNEGPGDQVAAAAMIGQYLRPIKGLREMLAGVFQRSDQKVAGMTDATRTIAAAGLTMAIGLAFTMMLLRSPDRGQVLFAVLVSFFAAALISHKALAPRHSMVMLAGPVLAGLIACVLASFTSIDQSPIGWANVKLYARALPIDWLLAGGAGVMLACWVAHRHHEWKRMETIYESLALQQRSDD